MASLTELPAWKALKSHHEKVAGLHMRDLFAQDPDRFERFSITLDDLFLDYSKNRITAQTMALLTGLAREAKVEKWRHRMFAGEKINSTENRAVLHTALRHPASGDGTDDGPPSGTPVRIVLDRMRAFSKAIRSGGRKGKTGRRITDVVNIGIGGSDLGPALAVEALTPFHHRQVHLHFVSNIDGAHLGDTLRRLDPATTLFIVTSKSFTTPETLANARSARAWITHALGADATTRHFAAVTASPDATAAFGIDPANVFPLWDWVGGRFSVWSAVGLPVAIAVGMDAFEEFLAGAHAMDRHFQEAPLESNMPVILALLGIWYVNFFAAQCHAVIPYSQHLQRLPDYLQQVEMESNGKGVTGDGNPVDYATAPVIFGAAGTNGQHAFFQLMHQGTPLVPADFIAAAVSHDAAGDHHDILISNYLAQTRALMTGRTDQEARQHLEAEGLSGDGLERRLPHVVFQGNRPTNSILMRRLDPRALGMLLAMYEHKIFVQGIVWKINSFDQWGVELGKQLATALLPGIVAGIEAEEPGEGYDQSTAGLIEQYRRFRT